MKLAIGTVQFGLSYGINNELGKPSLKTVTDILRLASLNKIDTLDTANSYGDSENIIGLCSDFNFKIVSKFSKIKDAKELEIQLASTLKNLRIQNLYAYLSHNPKELILNQKIWESLINLKSNGKINKIGYSVYTKQELDSLLKLDIIPDLIQLPFSLLDRAFESYLPELKSKNIEIHSRSVFLQGLYFMNFDKLPKKLESLKPALSELNDICNYNNMKMNELALQYVNSNKFIDKILIGVDSLEQLQNNIESVSNKNITVNILDSINRVNTNFQELLNPSNW
jgi:aryl-alcohol dehydrogenase-like predicted oxidoreductase